MRTRLNPVFFLILISTLVVNCSNEYEITEAEVTQHLEYLSSDALKGRKSLTPEIILAEDYIADSFQKAGLKFLNDQTSYFQTFDLVEHEISDASISVNGEDISDEHYIAMIHSDGVKWAAGDVETYVVGSEANFRSEFRELTNYKNDVLVFVDPAHEEMFSRYKQYFNRPTRNLEPTDKPDIVFVVSNPGEDFSVEINTNVNNLQLRNVVGKIDGNRTDEVVLFSAHHDHLGVHHSPVNGDSIANGANDNASGVSAILELAQYFSKQPKPERTLVFVTFTAEEMGGYGSKYFSQQMNPDEIVAMFNIEMIGKPAVSGPNSAWITGYERSTFGEILSNSMPDSVYEFYPDPYPNQNLFYRSDNATLARLGVPAHSISTTPIDVDKDYHQVTDEIESINLSHLTNTIKALSKAAEIIISGDETPTRVDISKIN